MITSTGIDTGKATMAGRRPRRSTLTRAGIVAGGLLVTGAIAVGGATAASASVANISYGSHNHTGVRCVQRAENLLSGSNYTKPHLWEDGKFGSKTVAATKRFQKYWHLRQDGIVGPSTGHYVIYELRKKDPVFYHACVGHLPKR